MVLEDLQMSPMCHFMRHFCLAHVCLWSWTYHAYVGQGKTLHGVILEGLHCQTDPTNGQKLYVILNPDQIVGFFFECQSHQIINATGLT